MNVKRKRRKGVRTVHLEGIETESLWVQIHGEFRRGGRESASAPGKGNGKGQRRNLNAEKRILLLVSVGERCSLHFHE